MLIIGPMSSENKTKKLLLKKVSWTPKACQESILKLGAFQEKIRMRMVDLMVRMGELWVVGGEMRMAVWVVMRMIGRLVGGERLVRVVVRWGAGQRRRRVRTVGQQRIHGARRVREVVGGTVLTVVDDGVSLLLKEKMIVYHRGLLRYGGLCGQRCGRRQRLTDRLALQRAATVAVQRRLAGQMRDGRVRRIGRSGLRLAAEQVAAGRRLIGALRMHVLQLDRRQLGYGQIRRTKRRRREVGVLVFGERKKTTRKLVG